MNYGELEKKNKDFAWFYIRALTMHSKKVGDGMFNSVIGWEDLNKKDIDIKLIINGVEVDFIDVWSSYVEAWERTTKKKAREIVRDRFNKIDDLYGKLSNLDKYVKDKINELFPEIEDEEDY